MQKEDWIVMMEILGDIRLFSSLALKKAKKGNLTSAQEVDLLFRAALAEQPLTPMALSHSMGTSKTIVSRLIDDLCGKGLIQKQYDRADRRSYSLTATEDGKKELDAMYRYYLGPLYELREAMGGEDFLELAGRIRRAAELMGK